MTCAAGSGEVKSAVRVRSAACTTAAGAASPSASTTAAGEAAKSRSEYSATVAASYAPTTWMLLGWVRLRWPMSEAEAAASRCTTAVLSRPAIQASARASRLSSCNRATSTWSIGLPCRDEPVQGGGVRSAGERLAQRPVAQQLGELGEDLQVPLGRLLGHEQHEDQRDRLAVRRVEGHGLREPDAGEKRLLEALDAAVRDGDAVAEARRAELLAREQAVEHLASADAVLVLEEQARLLEQALLARGLQVENDVAFGQELGDEAHRGACMSGARIIAQPSGRGPARPSARRGLAIGRIRRRGAGASAPRAAAPGACPCSAAPGGRACRRG